MVKGDDRTPQPSSGYDKVDLVYLSGAPDLASNTDGVLVRKVHGADVALLTKGLKKGLLMPVDAGALYKPQD